MPPFVSAFRSPWPLPKPPQATTGIVRAAVVALQKFPVVNASIDGDDIVYHNFFDVGVAVSSPRGLVVPILRDADQMSIAEIEKEIGRLGGLARDGQLSMSDMQGGTFTISNQGGIGGTNFTPVVFWPQAAILGVSRASTEPLYVDGEFRPRTLLPLALSYDHRIADGADAARFVRWIRDGIEQPLTLHLD